MQRTNLRTGGASDQDAETESSNGYYHLSAPAKGGWAYKTQHSQTQKTEQVSYPEARTCEKEYSRIRHPSLLCHGVTCI